MSWFSKKIIVGRLGKFFHIDNDANIEVSILGKFELKCKNLVLKTEAINKPSLPILIKFCSIGLLQVSFQSRNSSKKSLNVLIDNVKIVVALNKNQQQKKEEKEEDRKDTPKQQKKRPQLQQFYKAIGAQIDYQQRSFLQQQIFQLMQLITQYALSQLYLNIKNVDISLEYEAIDLPKYFGIQIQQIQAKQELISLNNSGTASYNSQNNIHCEITNLVSYIGVKNGEVGLFKDSQFLTRFNNIKKKYFLTHCTLGILLNLAQRSLQIQSNHIQIDFQDILIHEFLNLSQLTSDHFQKDIRFRPGQGPIVKVPQLLESKSKYNSIMNMSEGTLQWWNMLGKSIVEKLNKRTNNNLISNKKYRRYLFCLVYRYTFGAHTELQKMVDKFEVFKTDLQIMKQNKIILNRIETIRRSKNKQQTDKEVIVFISFILSIQNYDPQLVKLRLKKITYKDIRNSQIIINWKNCKKFILIKQTQQKNSFIIRLQIKNLVFNLKRPKIYSKIKNDIFNMTPGAFHKKKKKLLEHYCIQSILDLNDEKKTSKNSNQDSGQSEQQKSQKQKKQNLKLTSITYIELVITNLFVLFNNGNETEIKLTNLEVNDRQNKNKIVKISNLKMNIENIPRQNYSIKTMTAQKRLEFNVDLIFVQVQTHFVEKLLTILGYINHSETEVTEEEQKNFIAKFISKKVPTHPIFHSYKRDSKYLNVKKLIIAIPVFFNDRNFELYLKGIEFQDNALGKITFDIEQSLISRSTTVNTFKKIQASYRTDIRSSDEAIILANTRSYSGYIEQPGYVEENNQKSITNIIVPFLLVQLSFQNIYYLLNIEKLWTRMLSNPYYFPPKRIKKRWNISQVNPNAIKFVKSMQTRANRRQHVEITMQGIQFYLISDYLNEGNNKLIDMLVDNLIITSDIGYLDSHITIQLRDLFVRNALRFKGVNKESLIKCLKNDLNYGDQPVLYDSKEKQYASQQNNQRMEQDKQLLLFGDRDSEGINSQSFMKINNISKVDLQNKRCITEVIPTIIPIYIFYSLEFFQMLTTIFSTIFSLSSENLVSYELVLKVLSFGLPFSYSQLSTKTGTGGMASTTLDMNEVKQKNQDIQILSAPQFQQVTTVNANIKKLNLLAVKNSSVVMTISLIDLRIQHKTQPYLQRIFFKAKRFIIVDTSLQTGTHPKIIDTLNDKYEYSITGSFTKYKSQIIKHRQKKSAYFELVMQASQIEFLKKKVLELITFLMIVLRQTGVLAPPDQPAPPKQKITPSSEPPLRYKIQINDPRIILHRSSLSSEGFKSEADSIIVTNCPQRGQQKLSQSSMKGQETQRNNKSEFMEFQNNQGDEKNLFASFEHEGDNLDKQTTQKIYILLSEYKIYSTKQWNRPFSELTDARRALRVIPFLDFQAINIQFCSPEMAVNIPIIEGNMKQQDYRVLMRLTEQNLGQTPLLFVDAPRPQVGNKISFRTLFNFQTTELTLNVEEKSIVHPDQILVKMVKITLDNLVGKNQLWTNGQIFTDLSIYNMMLTTVGNDVQVLRRLERQYTKQLPQLPKSKAYTDITDHMELKQINKMAKKSLKEILTTQNQQGVKQFKNEEADQFEPEDEIGAQEKTNTGRISQWFKGMFKKCFKCKCCRKTQVQKKYRQNRNTNKAEQENDENIKLKDNKYKNRKANMVYKMEDILDFDYEIDWKLVQENKKKQNMVYLSFVIQPNGQKQMYMLAKQMQVLIENTKSLLGVIPFFGKPYSVYDVPKQVRKYKFNNNKPFKMLIQIDDTLAEIKTINNGKEQKICVICDAVYDSQSRGDATMGPGLSKLRIQSVARIFYVNQKYKQPVNLSDNFKVIYVSQTKIPYIKEDQRNKTKQIIMLSPHEAQDRNISFFIPAFTLKSLNRIIFDNFLKPQEEDKKSHEQQLIENMMEQDDMFANQASKTIKKAKPLHRANTMKINPQIKISGLQMAKNRSESAKFASEIRETDEKQQKKPAPAPSAPVLKNTQIIRLIYIDELTFQIESKLQSSFVKSTIDSIKYNEVFVSNKEFKRNIRNFYGKINITYWNLKLGVFQPFIQPWNFRAIQDVYERDNLSSSNMKIASDLQKKKGDAYVNDLNINVSVALFQVYKELMIYYEQETYDQNQQCIFLNEVDSDYDTLFNRNKNPKIVDLSLKIESNPKKKQFPKRLFKYFTRVFVPERHNINKYLKANNKYYFNPPGCRLFLYHSYFDHFRRKKCITYRTPYRIMNSTNVDLVLWFYDPKYQNSWKAHVRMSEYYAVPQQIYSSDLLLHITDQDSEVFPQNGPFVSVKYLIQMRAKKKNFTKIGPQSAVWKNIFKYSSPQTQKYIDFRDMIIRIGNRSFIAISVFSKHELKQQEQCVGGQEGDLKYYDAYCILQSPIIIDNYTHLDLSLTVNNTKIIKINKNQKIQINQNLSQRVSETAIEFLNDSIHEERRILFEKYGQTCKTMEIQKLQSVKLKITRQTTSSVLIKIYTEWNVSNYTKQCFSIRNNEKLVILDKLSFNCLSNISQKGIDICILHNQQHKKKIKPNNIADVITLPRMITEDGEKSMRYRQRRVKQQKDKQQEIKIEQEDMRRQRQNKNKQDKVNMNKRKSSNEDNANARKSINKMRPLNLLEDLRQKKQEYLSKQKKMCHCFSSSEMIYEHIDFVLNVKADPIEQVLTQKIIIRYRYQIRNLTSYNINLCQHDNTFLIAQMPPYVPGKTIEPQYIFYYDFLPQTYFFEVFLPGSKPNQVGKTLCSCPFKMDQFPGSTFIIKIKKEGVIQTEEYEKRYFYLRIQIKKIQEETLIEVKEGDTKDFPIYIDNLTDHPIKIVENQDQFILKSQSRVPFAWSHLMSNDYKLQVSIEGVGKQTYLFNNKSAFQPLKIVDKSQKKKRRIEKLYLKQNCYVKYDYLGIQSVCLVILDLFDNKLRIHNKEQNINMQINMNDVQKIAPLASKIQIYFENSQLLELMPPSRSIKNWIKNIQECVNQDVIDKIFFTIESYDNSRILFFRTIGDEQFSSNKMECSIDHLNISLIGPQPEQIILMYCGNISLIQHDKQNKLNYKNLELHESEIIMTVKKIKVSNQMKDAVNPVVISQIKKSNYPFMQLRLVRERLQLQNSLKIKQSAEKQLKYKQEEERITHYKEVSFFIDEAEVMVEAALFLKLFSSKKHFDHVNNQYAFGTRLEDKEQQMKKVLEHARKSGRYQQVQKNRKSVGLVNLPKQEEEQSCPPQVYINYLQIKPIKMTISVYLDHNSEQDIQMNFISILRYIPFGIQNAIVQLQCCQFFHVFYDRNQLKRQILKYYSKQAFNQIYKNAGSYDMFVPIQLVGGLGNGVKKIFYDPIYELVKKKQIKAVGKTFCEGILSFIIFLFGFLIKLVNVVFKMLAFFTFDQVFKTKRQAFRKQIFKSPGEGMILGAKYFLQVFKSFFTAFAQIKNYYSGYFIFGYIYGFFICIIKVIPWGFKLVVSLYDWLYVLGCGLGNWGYYEQSAMKTRSRPRRTFYHKEQIIDYNYFHALAIEIIQNNQLEEMKNEEIYFVESIKGGEDSNYLILSNYRIIHNYNRFTSMQEIKLYQLNEVFSRYSDYRKMYKMFLRLTIPNVHRFLFLFNFNVSQYKLSFASVDHILYFLKKLKMLSSKQDLNVNFIQGQVLKPYFKNFDQQLLQNFILTMNIEQIRTKEFYDKLEGQNIGERNKYIPTLDQNEAKDRKKAKKSKEQKNRQKEKEKDEPMIKSKSPLLHQNK